MPAVNEGSYLLIPIPKSPYYRLGPLRWQDWHRQVERTIAIARDLQRSGNRAEIAILSRFEPKGESSERELYLRLFNELAPELSVIGYKETIDTVEQVERSFGLGAEKGARIIFVSTWMHYPRVIYLAHGRKAGHYGAFGLPSPIFALIDPLAMIFQPLAMACGLGGFFGRLTAERRDKGAFW